MRTTVCSAIGSILIFFAVCGPASAMMCNNNADELKKLYEYAQLAEAAKSGNWDGMEDCVDNNGTTIAKPPPDIVEIIVPREFTDLVMRRVNEGSRVDEGNSVDEGSRVDDELKEFVILRPNQRKSAQINFKCLSGNNPFEIVMIEIAFRLFMRSSNEGLLFYLTGTEVTGTVVNNKSGKPVSIINGTEIFDPRELRANLEGEDCVFPLVQTTVGFLCEVLREGGSLHEGGDSWRKRGDSWLEGGDSWHEEEIKYAYAAFVEVNGHIEVNGNRVFTYRSQSSNGESQSSNGESQSLTMVGHSLGGSATQFVASNFPDECTPGGGFEFEAYTFSSPGLRDEGNASLQSITHQGFIIDGDSILSSRLFLDYFQHGRIALFTPLDRGTFWWAHRIDEVQEGICSCLRGEGKIFNSAGSKTNREIFESKPY